MLCCCTVWHCWTNTFFFHLSLVKLTWNSSWETFCAGFAALATGPKLLHLLCIWTFKCHLATLEDPPSELGTTGGFLKQVYHGDSWGIPKSSVLDWDVPLQKPSSYWGYLHDYGNPPYSSFMEAIGHDRWHLQELGRGPCLLRGHIIQCGREFIMICHFTYLGLGKKLGSAPKFLVYFQHDIMILCWTLGYSLSPQARELVAYYLIMRLCPIGVVTAEDLHEYAVTFSTHLHLDKNGFT